MQVRKALPDPEVEKLASDQLATTFAACGASWGLQQQVTDELDQQLCAHEHAHRVLVAVCETCIRAQPAQPQLPQQMLLKALCGRDSEQYTQLAKRATGGVGHVAAFLTGVAERCASVCLLRVRK